MPIRPSPTLRAAAMVAAALFAGCATNRSAEPFTMVSVDDVARMLGDPRVAIVDANPPEVFQEGHLPGARWYRSGPTLASVLPDDHSTRLVFYCAAPS
jgi:rhodanese-related sulfurtransferase